MKQKKLLMAKIDGALVETLLRVGYDRVRGRRELVNAVMKAVGEWERAVKATSCTDGKDFCPVHQKHCPVHYYLEPDGACTCTSCPGSPRIRVTTMAGGVVVR